MNDMTGASQREISPRQLLLLSEDRPDAAWNRICRSFWPGWRGWFQRHGGFYASSSQAQRALRKHMPEIEGLVEQLAQSIPDDPLFYEFLTFWCPPRYLTGCSQVAGNDEEGPYLVRNYDLDPHLSELTLLRSAWRGKRVIGMIEGLCGLSDGINENGLAVSLSFGGRLVTGRGFGVPLILRYLLECCIDVQDAVEALRSLPCHMSYNLTLADRSGMCRTALISPDRPAIVLSRNWATNHQLDVELPAHGRFSRTLERAGSLMALTDKPVKARQMVQNFLSPPLFTTAYGQGFGTLFTTLYNTRDASMELFLSDGSLGRFTTSDHPQGIIPVAYSSQGSRQDPAIIDQEAKA
ncbi:MAG: C45 family autoproteolytic acyltransferase/hydrolase [Parahaliea sp.]